MTSRCFLFDILKYVLTDQHRSVTLDKIDVSKVYSLSIRQGVTGVAFQGLRKVMHEHGIQKTQLGDSSKIFNKWFASTTSIILHHDKILQLQNKLSGYLQDAGIKALVLKGLSIAAYYDDNSLRCFGDLDIFSPTDYQRIDDILKPISTHFSIDYYRHSECNVDGVMVENHIYLTDVRGQSRFYNLEKFLHYEASASLAVTPSGGLYYPNECFTFIFFIYHALSHFLYEKLSLKFLVDWCWMLKGRKQAPLDILDAKLKEFGLMRFAAAITAICVDRLGLQEEFIPNALLAESKSLSLDLIERVEEDMFVRDYEKFSTNSLKDRLKRGKEFYKKSWKINEFLNVSTTVFLWEKVFALRKHKLLLK